MIHRFPVSVLIVTLALAGTAACGSDDDAADATTTTTAAAVSSTTAAGGTPSTGLAPLTGKNIAETTLSGAAEVPGPGDPDGSGTAGVSEQPTGVEATFCYQVTAKDIETPTAAHIHKGAADVAGPVFITLSPMVDDGAGGYVSSACMVIEDDVQGAVLANPENYYFNVHTKSFPDGAIRGQLPAKTP